MDDHEKSDRLDSENEKEFMIVYHQEKSRKKRTGKIHKYFIDIASHANNKCDDRITRRVYLNKDKEVSIKVVYFINNVTVHNNTIEIPQTVNGGYDFFTP